MLPTIIDFSDEGRAAEPLLTDAVAPLRTVEATDALPFICGDIAGVEDVEFEFVVEPDEAPAVIVESIEEGDVFPDPEPFEISDFASIEDEEDEVEEIEDFANAAARLAEEGGDEKRLSFFVVSFFSSFLSSTFSSTLVVGPGLPSTETLTTLDAGLCM